MLPVVRSLCNGRLTNGRLTMLIENLVFVPNLPSRARKEEEGQAI